MKYPNWAEIQQNPNPNSEFSVRHAPNHSGGYSQNVVYDPYQPSNVDPHSALFLPPQPRPPGVDPPYFPPAPPAVNYVQQPLGFEAQHGADVAAVAAPVAAAAAAYYPDPNVSWVTAIPQYGATPYSTGVISIPNPAIQPQMRQTWKKAPKKTKIVQSAWCEVCKIDCNSKDVLDQHKLGKKHLKNLQKLVAPTPTVFAPTITTPVVVEPPTSIPVAPTPVPPSASTNLPIIGPQENPENSKPKSQKSRKKAAARNNDLDTKRRKVLEGGAAANSVRLCNICNVVCNSDTVFSYHLAGQKHASMIKKYALKA